MGARGRELLARLEVPEPWRSHVLGAVELIDDLERRIEGLERELRELGAEHPYLPLLRTVPGVAWVLIYTIAAEIGDIERFASPQKLNRLHRPVAEADAVGRARVAPADLKARPALPA